MKSYSMKIIILLIYIFSSVEIVNASTQEFKHTALLEANVDREETHLENLLSQARSGNLLSQYAVAGLYFKQHDYNNAAYWYNLAENNKVADVVLIDANFYYYAFKRAEVPFLVNQQGFPTRVIFSFLNVLNDIVLHHPNAMVIVVTDYYYPSSSKKAYEQALKNLEGIEDIQATSKRETSRHKQFPEYKANRVTTPKEIKISQYLLSKIIQAYGYPIIFVPQVEADDVIATLTNHAVADDYKVVIASIDKDFTQLVNDEVTMYDPKFGPKDAKRVKTIYGAYPDQMVDYLSLMGDKADNIPGIPGIEKEVVVQWLEKYQTMDVLLENTDFIQEDYAHELIQHASQLEMARTLITLNESIELNVPWEYLSQDKEKIKNIMAIYQQLELKKHLTYLKNRPYFQAENEAMVLAQNRLGWMYKNGKGIDKNNGLAEKWYKKSAKRGDSEAQYYLGQIYLEQNDQERGYFWIKKAAKNGHQEAKELLKSK